MEPVALSAFLMAHILLFVNVLFISLEIGVSMIYTVSDRIIEFKVLMVAH
jgi:hypothetical protein